MISEDIKKQYAGLYLLRSALDEGSEFSLALAKDEKVLEPVFTWLYQQGYVEISADNTYAVTSKGRDVLNKFVERYREFVETYDVFCAVDLEAAEFAFSYYHDFDEADEVEWAEFLDQERWDDLRIAVASHKGFDPIEMVVVSFMNEGKFGETDEGWDYERLLGKVWEEVEEIVSTAIKVADLAYTDGNEIVKGEDVIEDIIQQGLEVMDQISED